MTHRDLRWAVAYQVVAWSALLGIQWVDPSTQAWLLYFTLFPQLWAMVPTRWAVIGTVVVVTAFSLVRWAQLGLLRRQPHRDPHLRHHLDGPVPLARAVHQPDRRRGREPRRRRSTSCAPPRPGSPPPSATAGCTRSASASRARSTTPSRRASPRWSPSPAPPRPRWPAVTPPRRGERLALIEHTASDNLDEARLIVAELTPGHLQSRTLGEALERLGAAVTSETGMRADVRVAGDPVPLGGSAEVVILRTAQEALSNVRRHASAARVDLTLAYDDPDEVVLTVHDDGLGFDLDGARSGFGLDGVQARAAEVGGAVRGAQRAGHRHHAATGGAAVIRLLVVDDHPVVRAGMVAVLGEESDFEVVGEAANGAEALGLVPRLRPDVVLMDLRMPVMDGAEATARITAQAGRAAGAGAHHLRHGCRHRAGRGGGRERLPAQGRPDRGAGRRDPAGGPRRDGAGATGGGAAGRPAAGARAARAHRARGRGAGAWSPAGCRTPTSAASCSSARRRSRRT